MIYPLARIITLPPSDVNGRDTRGIPITDRSDTGVLYLLVCQRLINAPGEEKGNAIREMKMRNGNLGRVLILTVSLGLVAACGPAAANEPTTTRSTASAVETTTTTESADLAAPDPDAGWAFNGDGKADTGGADLEFMGAHEVGSEAVAFDGHSGHAITSGPGPIDTTASFTVTAWVNYAAKTEIAAAVSQLADVTGIFQLGVGDHSQWWFMMKAEDQTGLDHSVWAEGPPTIPGGTWTHLVGVSDQTAGVIRLYLNGELTAETPFDAPLAGTGPLTVGRSQFDSSPANFWPGAIDSVAVYQTALTDDQISGLHERTKPTSSPPPRPEPDPSTYGNGILNGTWDYTLGEVDAQLLVENYADFVDSADEVSVRIGFDKHEWWQGVLFDGELILVEGLPEGSDGTFLIDGDVVVLAESGGELVFIWTLDDEMLTLEMVESCSTETGERVCYDPGESDPFQPILFDNSFTKSGDDPSY